MSPRSRPLLPALLALLTVLPALAAVGPAAAFPISQEQKLSIDSDAALPSGAPFGSWVPVEQTDRFYLHTSVIADANAADASRFIQNASTGTPASGQVPGPAPGSTYSPYRIDTQFPVKDSFLAPDAERFIIFDGAAGEVSLNDLLAQAGVLVTGAPLGPAPVNVTVGASAVFGLPPTMAALDDLHIHELSVVFYVDGASAGSGFDVEAFDVDPTGAAGPILFSEFGVTPLLDPQIPIFGTTQGPLLHQGRANLGLDGYALPKGHQVFFAVTRTSGPAILHLDTAQYPSYFGVRGDSARLNLWTENTAGEILSAFPAAEVGSTTGRTAILKFLEATVWGNQDCVARDAAELCPQDNLDQVRTRVRVRDMTPDHPVFGQLVSIDLGGALQGGDAGRSAYSVGCCSSTYAPIDYRNVSTTVGVGAFEYRYHYTGTNPDGTTFLNGQYQFEVFQDNGLRSWYVPFRFFIGPTGFTLELAPGESDSHTISVPHSGIVEATEFNFILKNTAGATDRFGLAVPTLSSGWSAAASPTFVTLAPGAETTVTVTVTPPAAGSGSEAGVRREVRLDAVSLSDNAIHSKSVTVTLTGQVTHGVELLSSKASLETRATLTQVFPITLRNLGTVHDGFVVTLGGVPAGWTANVQPAFTDVLAQSRKDLILQLTAPPEATPPLAFTLEVKAVSLDGLASDVLLLPVSLVLVDRLGLSIFDGNERVFRDVGDSQCFDLAGESVATCPAFGTIQDDDQFDPSAVYRVHLENQGDRADTYELFGSWVVPDPLVDDRDDCDENSENDANLDGVPDGWRYFLINQTGTPIRFVDTFDTDTGALAPPTGAPEEQYGVGHNENPNNGPYFSGENLLGRVTVPAGTVVDGFLQIGWFEPISSEDPIFGPACGADTLSYRSFDPADNAALRLTVRSTNDPALRRIETLETGLIGRTIPVDRDGDHPLAVHDVALEPAIEGATQKMDKLDKRVAVGDTLTYHLRAVNTGNEMDTLRVKLAVPQGGWPAKIDTTPENIFIPPTYFNEEPGTDASLRRACSVNPSDGTLVCTHMGVYDEVWFNVIVTPPLAAKIGDRSQATVTVTSGSTGAVGSILDSAILTSTLTGTFLFDVTERDADLDVEPADLAAFPFSIRNLGTNDDAYLLTIVEGDAAWLPILSSAPQVTVPAGRTFHGFLSVSAPPGVAAGSVEQFRIRVEGLNAPLAPRQTEVLDFFAHVIAKDDRLNLQLVPFTALSGTRQSFDVTATDETGSATEVTFVIEPQNLPRGWGVVCGSDVACTTGNEHVDRRLFSDITQPAGGTRHQAKGDFTLDIPVGELGVSRVAVRVCATTDGGVRACRDQEINLASTYGIQLPADTLDGIAAAGVPFEYTVNVTNTGLSPQTVAVTFSNPPAGWTVDPVAIVPIEPGETVPVAVTVRPPVGAEPGDEALILLQAVVQQATTQTDQVTLRTRIGEFGLDVGAVAPNVFLAPQETASYVVNVTNLGDFVDRARISVALPVAYTRSFQAAWQGCDAAADIAGLDPSECVVNLTRGQGRQVLLSLEIPEDLLSEVQVNMTLQAESVGSGAAVASAPIRATVLRYAAQDVDGDGVSCADDEGAEAFCAFLEYAIDRNQDATDGYEEFRENLVLSGIRTRAADLARFLSDEARASMTVNLTAVDGTVQQILLYDVDGDKDGFRDHFLDTDADGLPDIYWDPDRRLIFALSLTKDVTQDGVREYFIDLDGDGRLDAWFDLVEGRFGNLLQVFANADNLLDYVVDLDGDGEADPQDPILLGSPLGFGAIAQILQKVDMNGDGNLDDVIDEDADGTPDYFIPFGKTASIPITLKDVTGDGVEDWTYPSKGEGRPDSYYDPVTQDSGFIDTRAQFVQELEKYWYIGALFLVVLVLFAVLVAVTRR